jgi:hypothetical protein
VASSFDVNKFDYYLWMDAVTEAKTPEGIVEYMLIHWWWIPHRCKVFLPLRLQCQYRVS